ncbi:unnamed protein product, partial [Bubo scandiacus]
SPDGANADHPISDVSQRVGTSTSPNPIRLFGKYCIFSQEKLAKHKRAFEAADTHEDGYLNHWQVLMALEEVAPSEALTFSISKANRSIPGKILEIVDYYVTDGLTDLRLFAVMASLAQKIAALE